MTANAAWEIVSRPDHSLPPQPKRAAYGVAGFRSGSGQQSTNHALMPVTSAGQPIRYST
jgi:hypothetical protein